MAAEKKTGKTARITLGVSEDTAKMVRQLSAKMQLASGNKVSADEAIAAAVKAALK